MWAGTCVSLGYVSAVGPVNLPLLSTTRFKLNWLSVTETKSGEFTSPVSK